MCLFKKNRKIKKFGKIAREMFDYFQSEGKLCGKGISEKGKFISSYYDVYKHNPYKLDNSKKGYSMFRYNVKDTFLQLTFELTYYFNEDLISLWVCTKTDERMANFKNYITKKYNDKPFRVSMWGNGADFGMCYVPVKNEDEIRELIHQFRINWQESELHKLLEIIIATDYTYLPKDRHDYD